MDQFPFLLETLDKEKRLGVDQLGVSITTMEEVFCKIASEHDTATGGTIVVEELQE